MKPSTPFTRFLELDPLAQAMATVVPAAYTVVATGYAALATLGGEHISGVDTVATATLWTLIPGSAMLKKALARWREAYLVHKGAEKSPIPGLCREHWALIEPAGSTNTMELGQVVLRRNAPFDGLHVITHGEASESRPGVATLTREAGTVIGDEQFIMGELLPRTSSSTIRVSSSQATVWFIGFTALQVLFNEHPGLEAAMRKAFLQNMGQRLHAQSEQLVQQQHTTSTRALARMHSL
jgi:hypothetical protein